MEAVFSLGVRGLRPPPPHPSPVRVAGTWALHDRLRCYGWDVESSQGRVPALAACTSQAHPSAVLYVIHAGRASLNSSGPAVPGGGDVEDMVVEERSETHIIRCSKSFVVADSVARFLH